MSHTFVSGLAVPKTGHQKLEGNLCLGHFFSTASVLAAPRGVAIHPFAAFLYFCGTQKGIKAHHSSIMVVDKVVDHVEGEPEPPEVDALPVRVVARARPLLPSETIHSSRSCIAFDKGVRHTQNFFSW